MIKTLLPYGLLLLLAAFIALCIDFKNFYFNPVAPQKPAYVMVVAPGTPMRKLAFELQQAGYLSRPLYFIALTRMNGASTKIKAGEYAIKGSESPSQILQKMLAGDVVQHELTLVEGWTFADIIKAIEKQPNLVKTLDYNDLSTIMIRLGVNQIPPEGMFYPDTYLFPKGTTDKAFLRRAYDAMQNHLQKAWQERDSNLPYKTPYEALIAASLIEKETALDYERTKVASVIVNRLNHNMRLQIDPTVIYALGPKHTGRLHKKDLAIDSPYNTYKHRGLPPTPIAIPSLDSLNAALHPAHEPYLYFVAKGDGSHHFSQSLTEQNAAVRLYLLNR